MKSLLRFLVALVFAIGLLAPVVAAQSDAKITVYITRTGEKYHESGCRYLKKSKIAVTLKEAKERGYDACSVCDPPE